IIGSPRIFRDLQCMHGLPTNLSYRIFGSVGLYIKIGVTFTAPLLAVIMSIIIGISLFKMEMSDTVGDNKFNYPSWTVVLGFFIGAFPLMFVPLGIFANWMNIRKSGEPLVNLFRISDDHPAV
ncbi:hypothetical protein PFISCL1PPCAC_5482, partial [Pristionchus fissidentatus]